MGTKRRLLQQFKNTEQLTYYKTLEVEKTASFQKIKSAYYSLIKLSHPDRINKPPDILDKPDVNCDDCGFCEVCEIYEDVCGPAYRVYKNQLNEAEKRSKLLNEAWDILQDSDKREFYDEFLIGDVEEENDDWDSDS